MPPVRGGPDDSRIAAAVARIRKARATGDGFASFDLARKAASRFPHSLALAYQATLLAARLGALSEASRLYEHFSIGRRAAAGESDPLVPTEDLLALPARLAKDLALEASGPDRASRLAAAAQDYLAVFARTGGYYPLVNAADLFDLAGRAEEAARCASQTLALVATLPASRDASETSWRLLSAVEAHLVLGDVDRARQAARQAAAAFHGDYGDLGTTIRQLDRLAAAKSLDFAAGPELGMAGVLCYSGHIIAPPGEPGRFPAAQEDEVAAAIKRYLDGHRIGWAYGSLAAGADIMVVEALLARGIRTHLVLPFAEAEFIDVSVRPSGASWVNRFERCRRKATTCRTMVEGGYFHDDALFGACTAYALGLAKLQSTQLGASLMQLLVWDGEERPGAVAGTAADRARGQSVGATPIVIPTRPEGGPAKSTCQPPPSRARHARAMVFADVVGFSKIADDHLPLFHAEIMVPMAAAIAALPGRASVVETWGDAVFLVYDDVEEAAAAAMTLIEALKPAKPGVLQLHSQLDVRVSAHFGSTFDITNPFTRRPGCLGIHVSRAARIEPVTPPGVAYVSEAFAVQLALRGAAHYRADFVGTTKLAKKFGNLPVFRLVEVAPEHRAGI